MSEYRPFYWRLRRWEIVDVQEFPGDEFHGVKPSTLVTVRHGTKHRQKRFGGHIAHVFREPAA